METDEREDSSRLDREGFLSLLRRKISSDRDSNKTLRLVPVEEYETPVTEYIPDMEYFNDTKFDKKNFTYALDDESFNIDDDNPLLEISDEIPYGFERNLSYSETYDWDNATNASIATGTY